MMASYLLDENGASRELPARLGRYELLSVLAAGGMATVYLARVSGAAGFERLVAVKCCHPHLRHDPDFAAMFLDEARLAARLHHPNVVATLDVSETPVLHLVMEFVDGDRVSTLSKAAEANGTTIPVDIVVRILLDTLAGLDAAHSAVDDGGMPLGIVHRDVSPQNILVGTNGVTRITDFGIAKASARASITRDGFVKGKLAFMAPEQMTGLSTPAVDVFAAGVVGWQLLTGRSLFQADTDAATVSALLRKSIAAPSAHNALVPPALDAVLLCALERSPSRRYVSATQFIDALENCAVKPASHRRVAQYVDSMLGTHIAERRRQLRELRGSLDVPNDPRTPISRASRRPPAPAVEPANTGAIPLVAAASRPTSETEDSRARAAAAEASLVVELRASLPPPLIVSRPPPAAPPPRGSRAPRHAHRRAGAFVALAVCLLGFASFGAWMTHQYVRRRASQRSAQQTVAAPGANPPSTALDGRVAARGAYAATPVGSAPATIVAPSSAPQAGTGAVSTPAYADTSAVHAPTITPTAGTHSRSRRRHRAPTHHELYEPPGL